MESGELMGSGRDKGGRRMMRLINRAVRVRG